MTAATVLRHAGMDLLSAAGFVAALLLRHRLEPDAQSALLLWPVLFECMLAISLGVASMVDGIVRAWLRHAGFVLILLAFLGFAWLGGRASGLPYLSLAALWLLGARLRPPAATRWFGGEHRHWVFNDGMTSTIVVWVPAILAFLLLTAGIQGDCRVDATGTRVCKSPAWIFAAVWIPYFVAEALVRAYSVAAWHAKRSADGPR